MLTIHQVFCIISEMIQHNYNDVMRISYDIRKNFNHFIENLMKQPECSVIRLMNDKKIKIYYLHDKYIDETTGDHYHKYYISEGEYMGNLIFDDVFFDKMKLLDCFYLHLVGLNLFLFF